MYEKFKQNLWKIQINFGNVQISKHITKFTKSSDILAIPPLPPDSSENDAVQRKGEREIDKY